MGKYLGHVCMFVVSAISHAWEKAEEAKKRKRQALEIKIILSFAEKSRV